MSDYLKGQGMVRRSEDPWKSSTPVSYKAGLLYRAANEIAQYDNWGIADQQGERREELGIDDLAIGLIHFPPVGIGRRMWRGMFRKERAPGEFVATLYIDNAMHNATKDMWAIEAFGAQYQAQLEELMLGLTQTFKIGYQMRIIEQLPRREKLPQRPLLDRGNGIFETTF